jgi:hypothetical protein
VCHLASHLDSVRNLASSTLVLLDARRPHLMLLRHRRTRDDHQPEAVRDPLSICTRVWSFISRLLPALAVNAETPRKISPIEQRTPTPLPAKLICRGQSPAVVSGITCLARTATSSEFAGSRGVGLFGVARQSTCRCRATRTPLVLFPTGIAMPVHRESLHAGVQPLCEAQPAGAQSARQAKSGRIAIKQRALRN